MQSNTVHNTSHRKLAHTGLQETSPEIIFGQCMSFLEETVSLIRVAQIGRSNNHIFDLLSQRSQYSSRSSTRSDILTALNIQIVNFRQFTLQEAIENLCQLTVGGCPALLLLFTQSDPFAQLCSTICIELFYFIKNHERIFGITTQMGHRLGNIGTGSSQGLTMSRNFIFKTFAIFSECTFAHHGMTDDQGRLLGLIDRTIQRHPDLTGIVSVDADHIPAPRLIFGHNVFSRNLIHFG